MQDTLTLVANHLLTPGGLETGSLPEILECLSGPGIDAADL